MNDDIWGCIQVSCSAQTTQTQKRVFLLAETPELTCPSVPLELYLLEVNKPIPIVPQALPPPP